MSQKDLSTPPLVAIPDRRLWVIPDDRSWHPTSAASGSIGRVALLVADRVPLPVRYLIPLAERWGVGDDLAVENASEAERSELIEQVAVAPDELWIWLGDSDEGEAPTPEYVAFTCLTMAADAARAMRSQVPLPP